MKKTVLIFAITCSVLGIAQTKSSTNIQPVNKDLLLQRIDSQLHVNNELLAQVEMDLSSKNRYKLYPTENMHTFLELDTQTGKIKQVQWSLDASNEGSLYINDSDLTYGIGYGAGSFELYPTQNMFQFILLDKVTGRKWHVQWSLDDNRWIRRIY